MQVARRLLQLARMTSSSRWHRSGIGKALTGLGGGMARRTRLGLRVRKAQHSIHSIPAGRPAAGIWQEAMHAHGTANRMGRSEGQP